MTLSNLATYAASEIPNPEPASINPAWLYRQLLAELLTTHPRWEATLRLRYEREMTAAQIADALDSPLASILDNNNAMWHTVAERAGCTITAPDITLNGIPGVKLLRSRRKSTP